MKATRGRIALQSSSCEITQSVDLFREALGVRARVLVSPFFPIAPLYPIVF
jgi:hypothetical protein